MYWWMIALRSAFAAVFGFVPSPSAGCRPSGTLEDRMSSDVIIGYHGKPRCAWAGADDTAFSRYHDEVWGTRTYDEFAMFEALTLGVRTAWPLAP